MMMTSMNRSPNFSVGLGTLPEPVLEQVRRELMNWSVTGASVMEMSHRLPHYNAVSEDAVPPLAGTWSTSGAAMGDGFDNLY